MTTQEKPITAAKELARARQAFALATAKDASLGLLLIIDPIRAFKDAGITLSWHARKQLRRDNPEFPYGNVKLYAAVKAGKVRLPWIKQVRFSVDRDIAKST